MDVTVMDEAFRELVDEGEQVRKVCGGFVFTEGPVWHPVRRHLIFSDIKGSKRRTWSEREGVVEILDGTNNGNGLTLDAELNLLACEHSSSVVARFTEAGREVLASHWRGRELNSPNDIVVGREGAVWFTDPPYGRLKDYGYDRAPELDFSGVYRMAPGHAPGAEPELVVPEGLFDRPNGLCFSPDELLLYVNDTQQGNIRAFRVKGGALEGGEVFADGIKEADRPGVPDGMKTDARGNVWLTGPGGVWCYAPDGRKLGEISTPEAAANLAWGGDDWRMLFFTARTSVYAIRTKVDPHEEPFMRAG